MIFISIKFVHVSVVSLHQVQYIIHYILNGSELHWLKAGQFILQLPLWHPRNALTALLGRKIIVYVRHMLVNTTKSNYEATKHSLFMSIHTYMVMG